jgi:hypothetical protein
MSTSEFPEAGQVPEPGQAVPVAGAAFQIAGRSAHVVVLHNSRIVCWFTIAIGVIGSIFGVCMMLMVFTLVFPLSAISFMRVLAACQWGGGGLLMCLMLPWTWTWSTKMLHANVKLDAQGVDFKLGTKKRPLAVFMAWEQVAAVKQRRVGNVMEYSFLGKDGSRAAFTSLTFFRSKRVARMIAEHAGLTIQQG